VDRAVARTGVIRDGALAVLLAVGLSSVGAAQGRRVVDLVKIGDLASERAHEYAGADVSEGVIAGRPFREARGWQRYALTVYDDSEVALRFLFRGTEGKPAVFDLIVEGRKVSTGHFTSSAREPAVLEVRLPIAVTAGRTSLLVMMAAVDGPTPGLIELGVVQEHLERPTLASIPAAPPSIGMDPGSGGPGIRVDTPARVADAFRPPDPSPSSQTGDFV
jgi:hypothetical protein